MGAQKLIRGTVVGQILYAVFQSGRDPYRVYHGLDEQYRPIGDPDGEPRPPRHPARQRALTFAMARISIEGGLNPRQGR